MNGFSHLNWFVIGWLVLTGAIIDYAVTRIIRSNRRYKALERQLWAKRLSEINQPAEVERNEKMRREGKIW
jgi:hypothetical protein